ncbi:Dabb family protein [Robertkochia aurantiaca]|uniref:Dabb family protein n=1 Tax=Robertkochia aurantiaca TaxID=2873700 RepID=UPI001CCD5A58|nr:Dabb family protein [Robertkochia sp. 3YJGBD-33]
MLSPNSLLKLLFAVPALLLFTLTGCQPEQDAELDTVNLLNEYREALGSKSAENVADIFHDDAVLLAEGTNPIRGREAIIEHFRQIEDLDFNEDFKVQEIIKSGEYLIVETDNIGSWSDPESGASGEFNVKGQMILKKNQEGDLKIFRYTYNSNAPEGMEGTAMIDGNFSHSVYIWLTDDDEALRTEFKKALDDFIGQSQYISSVFIGTPAGTEREVVDNSYDYALIVTFESEEAHQQYQEEEAHDHFRETTKNMIDRIQIYDAIRP